MATLFLDFENGNNNYGGTSFATLADGTDGRINGTTFSSATASFPNDGSLIGQYLSIFNGAIYAVYSITAWVSATSLTIAAISGGTALSNLALDRQYYIGGRWKNITNGATALRIIPGDTIRIMGSPAPTSLGQNGVWTSQAQQATKGISGSTNATPIEVTCTAHGFSTGDTVVITGVATNTNANGTWEITSTGANTFTLDGSVGNGTGGASGTARLRNNTRVKLTSAVTQEIASTGPNRAAWTAVAGGNVTTSLETATYKEHNSSDSIVIAAGFTTGLAAYWPTGTLNLSGYQQVSFWIRQVVGTLVVAGDIELRLCSDAAGVDTVNTIPIPRLALTNRWMPVTVDLGTNLGSSIQSIALYVNVDRGAQTFLLNNVIACKASSAADSLTLTSLIGKNTTGETFWGIQSINGARVMLDMDTNATPITTNLRGYYGTSETVTTWKRETIKLGPAAQAGDGLENPTESGVDGNPITYSGGWDRTSMSTQNLETWLDGQNNQGQAINNSRSFLHFNGLAFVRFATAIGSSQVRCSHDIVAANNCTDVLGTATSGYNSKIVLRFSCANTSEGLVNNFNNGFNVQLGKILSNGGSGIQVQLLGAITGIDSSSLIANNGAFGIRDFFYPTVVKNIRLEANGSGGFSTERAAGGILSNVLINDTLEPASVPSNTMGFVASQNHDQVIDNHKLFFQNALISSATDQRHTPSGISWKVQPTSTNRSSTWPVVFPLAKVACAADSLVTVKAWMRRSNTGLTMRLVCKGGQIAGVESDVVDAMTAAADTWAEQTITFTPTEVGVVEITAEAWGGTTFSGWVDDMTISQA